MNFGPDSGCVSETECYYLRETDGADNKWFGWKFLNDEDYVAGWHNPQKTPNTGGYVINWKENKWYEITPPSGPEASWIAAWFDDVEVAEFAKPTEVRVTVVSPNLSQRRVEKNSSLTIELSPQSISGNVTDVWISLNGTEVEHLTESPYTYTWQAPSDTGAYTFTVTASDDQQGTGSTEFDVTVINTRVVSNLEIIPANAEVAPGAPFQFTPAAYDQYGDLMPTQPEMTWQVSGDWGTISQDGVFEASNEDDGKQATVTVSAGGLSATAQVNVVVALKINFMNNGNPPEGYLADYGEVYGDRGNGYSYGWDSDNKAWTRNNNGRTVEKTFTHMSALENGETVSFVWEIALSNGDYKVRITAGDLNNYFQNTIMAEGVLVTDSTIMQRKVLTDSANVTVSDGKLTLSAVDSIPWSKICAVEIISGSFEPDEGYRIISPNANENYEIGDTVSMRWAAAKELDHVIIDVSADSGKSWMSILGGEISRDTSAWGNAMWVIPQTIGETSLLGATLALRFREYDNGTGSVAMEYLNGYINIGATAVNHSNLMLRAGPLFVYRPSGLITVNATAKNGWELRLCDMRGRTLLRAHGTQSRTLDMGHMPSGQYLISIKHADAVVRKQVFFIK
ncbi:MAG: hypothetical protein GF344_16485 [Chitinivibrionales bacterium]|nr:hypothetical protein [Chitinivibrionales bacterium]MBD3358291.1 hypothetical protein [Chitinivibrionales bacterium]